MLEQSVHPVELDPDSPWKNKAAERAASAHYYSQLCDRLREDLSVEQQVSYETYARWEKR